MIKDHVLLPQASLLKEVDAEYKALLTPEILVDIVNTIPEEWLQWEDTDEAPEALRNVYLQFLQTRLNNSEIFVNQAQNAR